MTRNDAVYQSNLITYSLSDNGSDTSVWTLILPADRICFDYYRLPDKSRKRIPKVNDILRAEFARQKKRELSLVKVKTKVSRDFFWL